MTSEDLHAALSARLATYLDARLIAAQTAAVERASLFTRAVVKQTWNGARWLVSRIAAAAIDHILDQLGSLTVDDLLRLIAARKILRGNR